MTIVAGFPFNGQDSAGIELGATLARSAEQDLRIVTIVPAPWGTPAASGTDREFQAWAEEAAAHSVAEAEALIAQHCGGIEASAVAVHARSVPGGLLAEAERVEAAMLVVGSGHDGAYGRIALSSTADRLLHPATLPVAVATRGYLSSEHGRVTRATCAFRGDEVSRRTLEATSSICRDIGAALRIATFAVRGRAMRTSGISSINEDAVLAAWVEQAERMQAEALAELSQAGILPADVETQVAAGGSWAATLDRFSWDRDEVLVIGSSSASFMSRLFLGSSGTKIVRHSPVPVIVVP